MSFKKILTLILVVSLMSALVVWGCAPEEEKPPEGETKEPIKIGAVIPLSGGPFAEAGQEQRIGLLMAEKEINENGGILGRPLKLIIEDDQCKSETGIAACTKLITQDKVVALIGGYSSTITFAEMNAISSYEPIVVWMGASSVKVEHEFGPKKWFFHLHPWDYHRQSTVVEFFKSLTPKPKTIALTYEDGIYGTTSADYFRKYAKEAGFEIIFDEPHKSGSSDFTSLLTKVKAKNPDIFYSVSYAGDYIVQIKQAKEVDFSPKLFTIVAPLFPGYKDSLGKTGDYIVGVNPWASTLNIEGLKEWLDRLHKMYPEKKDIEYWVPLGYTNLMVVAEAIKKAGTTDKDKVIEALENIDMMTPFGRLKFEPSDEGGLHQAFTNLVMVQWQNLKPVVVFPPEVAEDKVIYPVPSWKERD